MDRVRDKLQVDGQIGEQMDREMDRWTSRQVMDNYIHRD